MDETERRRGLEQRGARHVGRVSHGVDSLGRGESVRRIRRDPTADEAVEAIAGNLCRCTGYQNIVRATLRAAELRRERAAAAAVPGTRAT